MRRLAVVLAVLLMAGCATSNQSQTKGLLITSGALVMIEEKFEKVAADYVRGCADGRYVKAQCDSFRAFGLSFKREFPKARTAWEAARASGNQAQVDSISATILTMKRDVDVFASGK